MLLNVYSEITYIHSLYKVNICIIQNICFFLGQIIGVISPSWMGNPVVLWQVWINPAESPVWADNRDTVTQQYQSVMIQTVSLECERTKVCGHDVYGY